MARPFPATGSWSAVPVRYKSTQALAGARQADVDQWLHHYNYERPHLGYRNMGNRSFETINEYLYNCWQRSLSVLSCGKGNADSAAGTVLARFRAWRDDGPLAS